LIANARREATHYDINLFRHGRKLAKSLVTLEALWTAVRDHLAGGHDAAVRARETASIIATARWSYVAALHRAESRGQHQRDDAPQTLPQFERRQTVSGIDHIRSSFCADFAGVWSVA
jgi:succinate dehydrogenase/fumarate reductase flavoprotein subunit